MSEARKQIRQEIGDEVGEPLDTRKLLPPAVFISFGNERGINQSRAFGYSFTMELHVPTHLFLRLHLCAIKARCATYRDVYK